MYGRTYLTNNMQQISFKITALNSFFTPFNSTTRFPSPPFQHAFGLRSDIDIGHRFG